MKLTLLVDMDPICYRAAQATEEELDFSQDITLIVGNLRRAKSYVMNELNNLYKRFDRPKMKLYFTGEDNFRKVVDPIYKGHRTKRKPAGYFKLVTWVMENYSCEREEKLEADDLIAIAASSGEFRNFVVVSPDKDLKQVIGRVFNGDVEVTVTPEESEYFLWYQVLCGDTADGYKGVPGIGPVKAKALLKKCKGDYWPAVLAAYEKADLTEEDAVRTVRVAQLLTKSQEVAPRKYQLFTPTGSQVPKLELEL
jgi:DNA polymerase I